ncbi:MerR family transcriptional regulator [Clostridium kluyveri]|uniref:HTH merR-type domain-containing protein n=1 Tax=Clostridium kluyveri TaxID=1534 RepID=A0A1L5F817_CLOKL|nr:MerR family transcriptional regulator [Clostridium kluyveri]APM39122.1 hypothetical protein BS101_10380 [Clostridium kluyveri]UZQ51447.1 helix-turn-helix domain-containing protein [Clostridium kluyveri]
MENNIINNSKINMYRTKDVAEMLNTNTQTIRNYCATFRNILDTNHKSGQHRNFTVEDINKLKLIKQLLQEKHLTSKQIIEYFNNSKNNELNNFDFKLLVQAISDAMLPQIEDIIIKNLQTQTGDIKDAITDKSDDINNNINKLLFGEEEIKTTVNQIKNEQTQYISRVQRRRNIRKKRGIHFYLKKFCFWNFLIPKNTET